jgi:hypothetical protein
MTYLSLVSFLRQLLDVARLRCLQTFHLRLDEFEQLFESFALIEQSDERARVESYRFSPLDKALNSVVNRDVARFVQVCKKRLNVY